MFLFHWNLLWAELTHGLGGPEVQKSGSPENQKSRRPEVCKVRSPESGRPEVWKARRPEAKKSGRLEVQMVRSRWSEVLKTRSPEGQKSKSLECQKSARPENIAVISSHLVQFSWKFGKLSRKNENGCNSEFTLCWQFRSKQQPH